MKKAALRYLAGMAFWFFLVGIMMIMNAERSFDDAALRTTAILLWYLVGEILLDG